MIADGQASIFVTRGISLGLLLLTAIILLTPALRLVLRPFFAKERPTG